MTSPRRSLMVGGMAMALLAAGAMAGAIDEPIYRPKQTESAEHRELRESRQQHRAKERASRKRNRK